MTNMIRKAMHYDCEKQNNNKDEKLNNKINLLFNLKIRISVKQL
jgi:hypothetical protein